ncbi:MAG: DNA-3-methyladenine glycosylase [Oligoflexia bacterium]|nr:DNA-3-methyladenine glycosylase [Oligoflexia bacterium]MBF0367057.1 DNA-3-methyladenine glycosylase [Oligoflexia bacterium]
MQRQQHPLKQSFFSRPATIVAPALIGCSLFRKFDDGTILRGTIVETEAYLQDDPACHAYRGITKRNQVMFGAAGFAYVYFIYGMYFCFNVVTGKEDEGEAVLIRALDFSDEGYDVKVANGPGKLCNFLQIDKMMNGISLFSDTSSIALTEGVARMRSLEIESSPRIGIRLGKEHAWRWFLRSSRAVSATKRTC